MARTTLPSVRRLVGAGSLALIIGLMVAPSATLAKGNGEVKVTGSCTARSTSELTVKHEDGNRIEVEFEVDQNRVGRAWVVTVRDNGRLAWKGSRITRAPSGSFTVHKLISNRAGIDTVVARAVNPKTGEVCRASAKI